MGRVKEAAAEYLETDINVANCTIAHLEEENARLRRGLEERHPNDRHVFHHHDERPREEPRFKVDMGQSASGKVTWSAQVEGPDAQAVIGKLKYLQQELRGLAALGAVE